MILMICLLKMLLMGPSISVSAPIIKSDSGTHDYTWIVCFVTTSLFVLLFVLVPLSSSSSRLSTSSTLTPTWSIRMWLRSGWPRPRALHRHGSSAGPCWTLTRSVVERRSELQNVSSDVIVCCSFFCLSQQWFLSVLAHDSLKWSNRYLWPLLSSKSKWWCFTSI